MSMMLSNNDQEDLFLTKEEDGGVDYFEWCASFLNAPKEGLVAPLSSSSSCSSSPPSEKSSPSVSPYSTPEQYPPPSPENAMSYYHDYVQEEPTPRIVMPQLFQTINIGLLQQYTKMQAAAMPALSHSQQCYPRPMLQVSHNALHHVNPHPHHHHHNLNHSQALVQHSSPPPSVYSSSKELLVIDQSQDIQKRKSAVLEVIPVGSEVPEFVFTPLEVSGNEVAKITMRPSLQLPQSFYRNCYEMLRMKVPGGNYEGYRVYVSPKLGYSGNAKRFKQGPDAGEKAFVLEGQILNQNNEPIIQCQACEEYFRDASRRILLIKNNVPINVKSGEFQLQMKLMCCSSHHNTPFYFHFSLYDQVAKRVVLNSTFAVNVKQWKNMGATQTTTKRRKTADSP